MKKIINVIFLFIISITGCADNNLVDTESVLLGILDSDSAAGISGFDSDDNMDLEHELGLETEGFARTMSDTLSFGEGYRIRFGRRVLGHERNVEFDVGEDTAIGLITHTIDGEFIAKAIDTSSSEQIDSLSFVKDFLSTLTRKVRFIKQDDTSQPDGYRWKIDAMTPMMGGEGDKVTLSDLSFYSLTEELEIGELLYSFLADDMGNMFISRDELPSFTAFSKVVVFANVLNNGPEYILDSTGVGEWVFLNYGRSRLQRGRRQLHDSGLLYDGTMNDNTHTGMLRIHGPGFGQVRGIFRTFIETIDLATIFVSDGGYNSNVWSIPYRVERP